MQTHEEPSQGQKGKRPTNRHGGVLRAPNGGMTVVCHVSCFSCGGPPTAQSVYSVAEEGPQSQSPVHTPLHQCRKDTKEDVEKEVETRAAAPGFVANAGPSPHTHSPPPSDLLPERPARSPLPENVQSCRKVKQISPLVTSLWDLYLFNLFALLE